MLWEVWISLFKGPLKWDSDKSETISGNAGKNIKTISIPKMLKISGY